MHCPTGGPQAGHSAGLRTGSGHLFPGLQGAVGGGELALAAARRHAARWCCWADPAACSFQFNPTGATRFTSPCDTAKQVLAVFGALCERGAAVGEDARVRIGGTEIALQASAGQGAAEVRRRNAVFREAVVSPGGPGLPRQADPAAIDRPGWWPSCSI